MLSVLSCLLLSPVAHAQDLDLPVLSPRASTSMQVGTVTVTVDYSAPAKRDRTVFGELVPWGEMWRTGANAATTLSVDGDVRIGEVDVPEGTYALMTIPGEEQFTLVLNTDLGVRPWSHDKSKDLSRLTVDTVEGPDRERLTFLFDDVTDRSATLRLEWAGVAAGFPIEVDTPTRATRSIERYVAHSGRRLSQAAMFQLEQGDAEGAEKLARKAVAVAGGWYATFTLAKVLHATDQHKEAYKTAKLALELGEGDDNFFYEAQVREAVETWPKK
jgi:hypothetical protein